MSNVPVIVTEEEKAGEGERFRADMLAWEPDHDDRTRPLLLAEAGRREAYDWGDQDAENVIAFLLSRLDEAFARHRIAATSTLQDQVEAYREALGEALVWHEAQDKAISKQPPCVDGQWRRMEHQEQAENLRAALTQKDISR